MLLDLNRILEYLWKAVWCFFEKGDSEAQAWVTGSHASGAAHHCKASVSKNRNGLGVCCDYLSSQSDPISTTTNTWQLDTRFQQASSKALADI
jgi:hypothetical protein